jgi:membrane protease YdiL (CAAX protease family)
MQRATRNIISVLLIAVPFYFSAILEKAVGSPDVTVNGIFGMYLLYTFVGLLVIYLTNKYLLKNTLNVFASQKGSLLLDISIAFLYMIFAYFVFSVGNITYGRWIPVGIDRTQMIKSLNEMFSNPTYTVFLLGPFIWMTEGFLAFSRAFILNNLWEINQNKYWAWTSIVLVALLGALIQINNGPPAMINWFIILMASGFIYFKYRRIYPLLIAGILMQTIELVSYWVYVY